MLAIDKGEESKAFEDQLASLLLKTDPESPIGKWVAAHLPKPEEMPGFQIVYLDENGLHTIGTGPEVLHDFFSALFDNDNG